MRNWATRVRVKSTAFAMTRVGQAKEPDHRRLPVPRDVLSTGDQYKGRYT